MIDLPIGARVAIYYVKDEPRLNGQKGSILERNGKMYLIELDNEIEGFPTGTALVFPHELEGQK